MCVFGCVNGSEVSCATLFLGEPNPLCLCFASSHRFLIVLQTSNPKKLTGENKVLKLCVCIPVSSDTPHTRPHPRAIHNQHTATRRHCRHSLGRGVVISSEPLLNSALLSPAQHRIAVIHSSIPSFLPSFPLCPLAQQNIKAAPPTRIPLPRTHSPCIPNTKQRPRKR